MAEGFVVLKELASVARTKTVRVALSVITLPGSDAPKVDIRKQVTGKTYSGPGAGITLAPEEFEEFAALVAQVQTVVASQREQPAPQRLRKAARR